MEYRIEKKPEFMIAGLLAETTAQNMHKNSLPAWKTFMQRIDEVKNRVGDKILGVAVEVSKKESKFRYILCCEVSKFEDIPHGLDLNFIEESKYAVFVVKDVENAYPSIDLSLRKTDLRKKNFWFEVFNQDGSVAEIWIAVE
jgi:predicted transcriptional regulator YdeE